MKRYEKAENYILSFSPIASSLGATDGLTSWNDCRLKYIFH